jgi:hypothetical protein
MAKRNFALVACVVLAALPFGKPLVAQPLELGNSCSVLGEVVRQAAVNDILATRGEAPFVVPRPGMLDDGLQSCANTSNAVSAAYTHALAQLGIYIRWSYLPTGAGSVCLSHDLGTCYPFVDPAGPTLTPPDFRMVTDTWGRLRAGVATNMPWGTSSDITFFRASSLSMSLRSGSGPLLPDVGSIGDF